MPRVTEGQLLPLLPLMNSPPRPARDHDERRALQIELHVRPRERRFVGRCVVIARGVRRAGPNASGRDSDGCHGGGLKEVTAIDTGTLVKALVVEHASSPSCFEFVVCFWLQNLPM